MSKRKLNVSLDGKSKTQNTKLCTDCGDPYYGSGKYCTPFCKSFALSMRRKSNR